jgi:hypothetical protein
MKYGFVFTEAIRISIGFATEATPAAVAAIDAGTLICFR